MAFQGSLASLTVLVQVILVFQYSLRKLGSTYIRSAMDDVINQCLRVWVEHASKGICEGQSYSYIIGSMCHGRQIRLL